jgi:branched-chain amino acid transport system ATP-binding protein
MSRQVLVVSGLGKSFGALQAISDLHFHVEDGEIVGLIGPNGAGKTTAINLISGRLKPDTGMVRLEDKVVTGFSTNSLVQRGLVRTFQSTAVYPERSVWSNVLRGAFAEIYKGFWPALVNTGAQKRRRDAAIVHVETILDELGLQDVRDVPAQQLPYGRQKTLGLAIAIASRPRVILLDEPAAGLSAEEVDRVADVIRRINSRGVSVVVVDHNMRFISGLCRRVVVLHHGKELCTGKPAEIAANPQVIEAYLGTVNEPA